MVLTNCLIFDHRCADAYQLLQCEVGYTCDGHFYGHQGASPAGDRRRRSLVVGQWKYRALGQAVLWWPSESRLYSLGLL